MFGDASTNAIPVVRRIGKEELSLRTLNQRFGNGRFVCLPGRDFDVERLSGGIDERVDLG